MTRTSTPAHLRWSPEAAVPAALHDALLGPGAPFELVVEPVRGTPLPVFAARPRSLRQMFERYTADSRDLVFLAAPERDWTYAEALADIDALAVLLQQTYGVRAGDRVDIVAANCAEYALLMWAVVSLGAIVTSLNGWWTTHELAGGIELSEPVLIAGDERRLARLPHDLIDVPVRDLHTLYAQSREFVGRAPDAVPVEEDDPAVILFTSGTTGRPKGATLSHRNIINFAMASALAGAARAAGAAASGSGVAGAPRTRPCVILTGPMFHVSGMVGVLMTGVVFRTKLVLMPPGAWDPAQHLELTHRHSVTSWSGVPTQFWRLMRHPDLDSCDVSSVVTVSSGGALLPPELVRELRRHLPAVSLGNGYGMSETVGLGTLTGGALLVDVPESVGAAQPTGEVQIRDENQAVLGQDEVGEIWLRSPSVFLGYWKNPAATAASLDAEGWYRTGDYGRVSGGLLFLESRLRDLIIRGGENIYPIEIENRLVEHPEIDDAAVIGVDDEDLGMRVKAIVVRSADSALDVDAVRAWCAEELAGFKVPAEVEFRAELPYSVTGKLLKTELEAQERERLGLSTP